MPGALETILPATAVAAVSREDIPDATLFPREETAITRALEGRRREFATARACARAALEQLGLSRRAVPVGAGGAPEWPAGIVGSITHCDGYRACAVALRGDLLAIGIDAEPNQPLSERVLDAVAFGGELVLVRRLADAEPTVHWDRLLFSAKEAVFKAWFPLTERRLGFGDAALTIDPCAGAFSARLLVRGPPLPNGELRSFDGRWALDGGVVLTTVAVSRL
jgi:4'-phosphopantetheinyl transferase EntD